VSIKKGCAFLAIALLVGVSGCKRKQKAEPVINTKPVEIQKEVDIPFADENIRSFFDEDINEFSLEDTNDAPKKTTDLAMVDQGGATPKTNDFAFVDDAKTGLKVVYFDFDRYNVRDDQEASLTYDIEQLKTMLTANQKTSVVIDGHADHSAGSRIYNMALSEKRAKVVADRLAAAGIAKERIKIVGRGAEMPALNKDGKVFSGDRVAQWPNRRDEMHVIS
jgi:outer membrane protein OmpA-like peptidoglycan-associated protein